MIKKQNDHREDELSKRFPDSGISGENGLDDDDFEDDLDMMNSVDGALYEVPGMQPVNPDPVTGEPRVEIVVDPTINRAFDASNYLKGVLLRMKLSGRIEVNVSHGSVHLEILGAEPGLVIGHRGQNLDALQHLVNRMVNKDSDNLVPITVDADNYRIRRHQQLERMVKTVSRDVLDTGKAVITDPMTPSERRLFHIAANRIRGIRTTSFGSGFFQPIKVFPAHLSSHSYYQDRDPEANGSSFRGGIQEYGDVLDDGTI
ncbi:KH domain-containing protein [bacterium]|nr:KH domain-containing protein [candidate division CSSED10-310 bacterium]